jgi:diacylglycerol O-acyltransferase
MALSGLAARAAFQLVALGGPPFNLMVSNVPGPQLRLYVAGARVLGIHPASAISDVTGALNITVFSYDGSLDFGLIACRELVPDVWNLIDYLRDGLDELVALAAERAPGAAEPAHTVAMAAATDTVARSGESSPSARTSARKTAKKTAAARKRGATSKAAKKASSSHKSAPQAPRAASDPNGSDERPDLPGPT